MLQWNAWIDTGDCIGIAQGFTDSVPVSQKSRRSGSEPVVDYQNHPPENVGPLRCVLTSALMGVGPTKQHSRNQKLNATGGSRAD
jgi:hypothetical protein